MYQAAVSERVHEFEELCRQQGLPITVQRRAVFEAVVQTTSHPTADQVFDLVRDQIPGISRTTVYRVLDVLSRVGLIQRLPHPMSTARFDGDVKRHHHLVCRVCGNVHDVFDDRYNTLAVPSGRPSGFRVEDYSIVFTGTCAACRGRN